MTFVPSPAGSPGVFPHVCLPPPKRWKDGPHGLVLFFRALAKALEPPLVGSSSHGIRVSPSHRHTSHASTPGSRGSLRAGAAKRRLTFRPRGFAPPRRLAPRASHGSVAPRNRSKVRRVSCAPPSRATRRRPDQTVQIPATRFTPFEDFPSSAAVPHHCGRCPPVVTVLPDAGVPAEAGFRCRPPLTEARGVQSACPYPRVAGGPAPRGWVAGVP